MKEEILLFLHCLQFLPLDFTDPSTYSLTIFMFVLHGQCLLTCCIFKEARFIIPGHKKDCHNGGLQLGVGKGLMGSSTHDS